MNGNVFTVLVDYDFAKNKNGGTTRTINTGVQIPDSAICINTFSFCLIPLVVTAPVTFKVGTAVTNDLFLNAAATDFAALGDLAGDSGFPRFMDNSSTLLIKLSGGQVTAGAFRTVVQYIYPNSKFANVPFVPPAPPSGGGLQLPVLHNATLKHVNLSGVGVITIDFSGMSSLLFIQPAIDSYSQLTNVNLAGCAALTIISITNCDSLGVISCTGCVSVTNFQVSNCDTLFAVDITPLSSLTQVQMIGNDALTAINVTGLTTLVHLQTTDNALLNGYQGLGLNVGLNNIDYSNCGFDLTSTRALLVQLDADGTLNGTYTALGGTNVGAAVIAGDPPALAAATNLVGKGWVFNINP